MSKIKNYYYEKGGQRFYYNINEKKFNRETSTDDAFISGSYLISDGYDIDNMDEYHKKFIKYVAQLRDSKIKKIKYLNYGSDYSAPKGVFYSMCDYKDILTDNKFTYNELIWANRSHNGAHTYINKKYIDKVKQCYTYDYTGFYPWLLSNKRLKIPLEEGKEYTLKSTDDIDYSKPAYYRVYIEYTNKKFEKIFQFSHDKTYIMTQLRFITYLHKEYPNTFKKGDVTVKLIQDGQPNAYIYEKYITGDKVFGQWYDTMRQIKEENSNNFLVKWLTSALWGHLSRYNKKAITELESLDLSDIEYHNLVLKVSMDKDYNKTFKVIDKDNIGNRIVGIKSFLSGLGREYIASAIIKFDPKLNNIVRCFCDSLTLRIPINKIPNTRNFKLLHEEDKSTGKIYWKSLNSYYNITEKIWVGHWKECDKEKLLNSLN